MARRASSKVNTDEISTTEIVKPTKDMVSPKKEFDKSDLIQCRSLTQGELLLPGPKSGILYRWSAYGDITFIEYQDLYAMKASRSGYLYKPFMIIEDEDLLSDPRWSDLKELYSKLFKSEDLNSFLALPLAQFKQALKKAPEGYRKALCIEAATQIEAGIFDSMNKIKVIDEICGTDLASIF